MSTPCSTGRIPSVTFRGALDTSALRAEQQRLQSQLRTRASTPLFAQSAFFVTVALILGSAAGKLFWDSVKLPYLGILAAAVSLFLAVSGWMKFRRALRLSREEEQNFAQLQEVQRALGLDDPAGLLPNR